MGGAESLAQSEAEAAKYWQERIAEVISKPELLLKHVQAGTMSMSMSPSLVDSASFSSDAPDSMLAAASQLTSELSELLAHNPNRFGLEMIESSAALAPQLEMVHRFQDMVDSNPQAVPSALVAAAAAMRSGSIGSSTDAASIRKATVSRPTPEQRLTTEPVEPRSSNGGLSAEAATKGPAYAGFDWLTEEDVSGPVGTFQGFYSDDDLSHESETESAAKGSNPAKAPKKKSKKRKKKAKGKESVRKEQVDQRLTKPPQPAADEPVALAGQQPDVQTQSRARMPSGVPKAPVAMSNSTSQIIQKLSADPKVLENTKAIWNSDRIEEQRQVRKYWLSLNEVERRAFVLIEKEVVMSRVREHQNFSCNCNSCTRKREAIEHELDCLYDCYY
ncbi:Stress response protein nst1, partial [Linderina pennispora]